ncbi:hypothetical protein ACFL3Z_02570 [Gemmatimonadota bacterium]
MADSDTRLNGALEVRNSIGPNSVRVGSPSPHWAGECVPTDAELMGASDMRSCTGWRSAVVWIRYGFAMIVMLSGCDLFDTGADVFGGLTNPLVLQGLVLSIDAPPAGVDLASAGLVEGASATVFLADAAEASALAQVPVREAEVRLTGPSIGSVTALEVAHGTYAATPADGLAYFEGETLELRVTIGSDASQAGLDLPAAPVLSLPSEHPTGTDLVLDLTGQGFDAAVVVVFGPAGLTYSNVPGDIEELYSFTRTGGNPVVRVPGSALGQTGGHAVGVAGLVKAGVADFANVNTVLSSLGAAKMVFASVTVQ